MKKTIFLTTVLLFIDQLSKIIIRRCLGLLESVIIIPSFLSITYVENNGAAFSILEGKKWLLIIVTILVLLGMLYYLKKKKIDHIDTILYSLILSGILGNLIDRMMQGTVTDLIAFTILKTNMPIFNLADTFICIGCISLFIKEEICKK